MTQTETNTVRENSPSGGAAAAPDLAYLIARCALRDQAALNRLYHLVSAHLNAVIFRIVRSNEVAEDVLQEAFIQIWDNANSYRSDLAKPLTWMTSIARYRALDRLDKEKRLANKLVSNDDDGELHREADASQSNKNSPELAFYWHQQSQHIIDCLSALSEQVQSSIKLAYIEGYSRDEIAQQLNTNSNTVKSWLHRGAERLRECLKSKI